MSGKNKSWMAKLDKAGTSSKTETTVSGVILHVAAATSHPFMMGTVGPINPNVVDRLKKCRSPGDDWTYGLRWWKEMTAWAHLFTKSHPAFCTLGEFLESKDMVELLDDTALIDDLVFHKDSLTGPVITEQEAIALNLDFDPGAPSPPSPPSPPGTSQASRRRRFQNSEPWSCLARWR